MNAPLRAPNLHQTAAVNRDRGRFLSGLFGASRDLEREFQPHALAIQETPPSPFTRIVLWALAILLAAILVWAWISTIPISTSAPAKFETDVRTKVVQTLNSGTVVKILVEDGQAVRQGEPLVELDPMADRAALDSQSQSRAINHLQSGRIRAELSGQRGYAPVAGATPAMSALEAGVMRADLAHLHSQIASDRRQISEARANLAAGQATLAEYTQHAALDRRQVADAAPLVPEGAMSGEEFNQLKAQEIEDTGKLAAQTQQVEQLRQAVKAAQAQLAIDTTQFADTQYQALETTQSKSYDIESQYVAAKRQYQLDWLRSPVDGTVQDLNVASLGTVVQPGQTLATVVPAHAPVIVEADLPAQSAGFVKVGQRVSIKVTAYPFEQYGTIPGRVTWVSPAAETQSSIAQAPAGENHQSDTPAPAQAPASAAGDSAGNDTGSTPPPTLYYRVHVQPERNWLSADGARHSLYPGMTATVDIHTGQRRVLDFFLDPIVKYLDNGLGAR